MICTENTPDRAPYRHALTEELQSLDSLMTAQLRTLEDARNAVRFELARRAQAHSLPHHSANRARAAA
jgi:hypothetical protein